MSELSEIGSDGFEFRTADGISSLVCVPLEQEGFVAAFSTRDGAVEGETTAETAARLTRALGHPGVAVTTCKQIHSNQVRLIRTPEEASAPEVECDGLTARQRGLLLGIKSADCVPVLIADRRTRAVAAVHAGWRGTVARITERAFATMIASWSTRRSDCIAAIGPAICGDCYEVGSEVLEQFRKAFPYAKRFVEDAEDGKGYVDLKEANAIQLELCGFTEDQIVITDRCTMCENDRFFSYRIEGARAGRILSVVGDLP